MSFIKNYVYLFTIFLLTFSPLKGLCLIAHEVEISSFQGMDPKIEGLKVDVTRKKKEPVIYLHKKAKIGMGMGLISLKGKFDNKSSLYWNTTRPKDYKKHTLKLKELDRYDPTTEGSLRKRSFEVQLAISKNGSLIRFQIEDWDGTIHNEAYFMQIPSFDKIEKQYKTKNTIIGLNQYSKKYPVKITKVKNPKKLISKYEKNIFLFPKESQVMVKMASKNRTASGYRNKLKVFVLIKGISSKIVKKLSVLSSSERFPVKEKIARRKNGYFSVRIPLIWSYAQFELISVDKNCKKTQNANKGKCLKHASNFIFSHKAWYDNRGKGNGLGNREGKYPLEVGQGKSYVSVKSSFGSSLLQAKDVDFGFQADLSSKSLTRVDIEWKTLVRDERFQLITNFNIEQVDRVVPEKFTAKNTSNSLMGLELALKKQVFQKVRAGGIFGAKQLESGERIYSSSKVNQLFLTNITAFYVGAGLDYRWFEGANWALDLNTKILVITPINSLSGGFQYLDLNYTRGDRNGYEWGIGLRGAREQHTTDISQNSTLGFNLNLSLSKNY